MPKVITAKCKSFRFGKNRFLTVVEAAKYFQIGESNIRRLTREHKDQDFVLWKDNRVYIRRKEMESFLDTINEI